jgi:fatty-acyl-CoA synthase
VVYVVLKAGHADTPEALLARVAPRIAERPAVPKRVTIVDAVPMTAIGKIYKPALRLRAAELKLAEMLADVAEVTVEGEDRGGSLLLRVKIAACERERVEAVVLERLAPIALAYEVLWN